MLSASAWLLLQQPAEPKRSVRGVDAPPVIRVRAPSSPPETRREPERRSEQPDGEPEALADPGELDVDEDELGSRPDPDARRPGFLDGLLEGLSG